MLPGENAGTRDAPVIQAPMDPVGQVSSQGWQQDVVLGALQASGRAMAKDELQEAVGMGPADLREALDALVDEGVVQETAEGWEADPTAVPASGQEAGVIGPGDVDLSEFAEKGIPGPPAAGVPWEAPDVPDDPEGPFPPGQEAREEPPHVPGPARPSVSGEAAYGAEFVGQLRFKTSDDPLAVARVIAQRIEELAGEVLGVERNLILETVDETRRIFTR